MSTKIIRSATVPESLNDFCKNILRELSEEGYEVVAVSSPGKDLQEVEEREGIRTVSVPMKRRISPLKDLISLLRMINIIRKERPTIIHSMTPKAGLLSMLAGWICKVPVRVHTFTGLVFPTSTGVKRKILMLTDKITCACATHVIPEGEGVKADLINNGITKKPLRVLGHGNVKGIDLKLFNPDRKAIKKKAKRMRKELGISDGDFVFLFIGRLVGDKGLNELILEFKNINAKHPNCKLILVGREEKIIDPLKSGTISEIEMNPAIFAVGMQKDVCPWYAMSDAFVFPSYREGFPNCVIEAGAMGLPSIVTDINGSREIIIDGENGIIIPSKDYSELFEAMDLMIEDSELRERLARNARGLIESRFEQSYVRKCLKDFYREILRN